MYLCTSPLPLPPNQTILPSFVVKLPPTAPTTKKLRSSDIVGLIRVDPFLIESFILASLCLRCNSAVCFPSLNPSSQDHPILIVTTWQHVSRANSLLCSQSAASQPNHPTAQPHSASPSRAPAPTNYHHEQVQRPPPRADKTPVHQPNLFFRTKGPRHHPSSIIMHTSYRGHHPPLTAIQWYTALCSLELAQGVCRGTPTSVLRFWPTAPGRPSPPSLSKG